MMLNITDPMDGIQKAKSLLKQGKTAEARAVLRYMARQYPDSVEVWLLSEHASVKTEEKMYCLVQVLRVDPESVEAHARMAELEATPAAQPPPVTAPPPRSPLPPPPIPAREVLEPVTSPLERPVRQTISATVKPLTGQTSQGRLTPTNYAHTPAHKAKPTFRWWFVLFVIVGFTLIGVSAKYDYFYDRFDRWQMKTYGEILEENWHDGSQYKKRMQEFENSASNMNAEVLIAAGKILGGMSLAIWFIDGVVGGFMLAIKKLRGSDWAWLLVLMPVVLFPAYLAMSGLLGEVMYAIGKYSGYVKKKCPQCKGWIPISATRCQHCGQALQ